MTEAILWRKLRVGLNKYPNLRMMRIESSQVSGSGIPDVNLCVDGVEAWLELKAPKLPKRDTTAVFGSSYGLTHHQVYWHRLQAQAGGHSFILIAVGDVLLLIPGASAHLIAQATLNVLQGLAVWQAIGKVKWFTLIESLLSYVRTIAASRSCTV